MFSARRQHCEHIYSSQRIQITFHMGMGNCMCLYVCYEALLVIRIQRDVWQMFFFFQFVYVVDTAKFDGSKVLSNVAFHWNIEIAYYSMFNR